MNLEEQIVNGPLNNKKNNSENNYGCTYFVLIMYEILSVQGYLHALSDT